MAVLTGNKKAKLYVGNEKVKRVFAGDKMVYSAGNICTYHVDGVTYQEEVDEGASCLAPTSFTLPDKAGYTFAGWSLKHDGDVLTDLVMGDESVDLYAIFCRTVTVPIDLSRGITTGDATLTKNVTAAKAISVSISGELKADVRDVEHRCDAVLYVNGVEIAKAGKYKPDQYNNLGDPVQVSKSGLGPYASGIIVKLYVHPHSTNRGAGSFVGSVTFTEIV